MIGPILDLFEAIAGGLQGGMAGKELDDELFSSPDLFHQEGQGWSQQLRLARGSVLEAIFCPEPLFDQLGAVLVQLAELLQDRILGRIQRQIVRAAIVGEHLGVDRITLGLQSLGLGVVPHPIRRHHANVDLRAGEVIGHRLLVSPGVLADHAHRALLRLDEPGELAPARRVVGHTPGLDLRCPVVETCLGHIEPKIDHFISHGLLFLACELRSGQTLLCSTVRVRTSRASGVLAPQRSQKLLLIGRPLRPPHAFSGRRRRGLVQQSSTIPRAAPPKIDSPSEGFWAVPPTSFTPILGTAQNPSCRPPFK